MQIFIEKGNDYRVHPSRNMGDSTLITLNYLYSEDGQRYFPSQTEISLKNAEWWEMQIEFDKKIKELE